MSRFDPHYLMDLLRAIVDYWYMKCFVCFFVILEGFFFGDLEKRILFALLTLIIFDFVTGILASKMQGIEIKSAKVFRSAVKVIIYFTMVASANLLEITTPLFEGFTDEIVVAFLAVTELISIFENIGNMGFVVPKKLLNKLHTFRDENLG